MEWVKVVDLILRGVGVVGTIGSVLFGLAWWSLRRSMLTREDFAKYREDHAVMHAVIDSRLDEGVREFIRLNETLKHLPTKDDLGVLVIRVEQLTGEVRVATEVIRRVEAPVAVMVQSALESSHG